MLTRDRSLTHNYHHSVAAIVALLAMRSFACFPAQAYWSHTTARSQNAPARLLQWFEQVVIEDWVRYLDGALTQPDQPSGQLCPFGRVSGPPIARPGGEDRPSLT